MPASLPWHRPGSRTRAMMPDAGVSPGLPPPRRAGLRAAAVRWALLFLVWIALAGTAPPELAVGALAAALAARVSLTLLPPSGRRTSPAGLVRLALRLPLQTLLAGIDVAQRAFARPPRLRPGYLEAPSILPAGHARATFRAVMSVQPGSLPVAEAADGTLLVHALDITQPVAAQYAREQALFAAAIGEPRA